MKVGGLAAELEGKPGDAFELAAGEAGAVGRKEDARAGGGDFERGLEKRLEVALDLEAAALVAAGKGGRIEDDGVECFAAAGQALTSRTSSARKRWVPVSMLLRAKFARPRSSDFFERSMLTVSAPASAAATEKEQV